MDKKEREIERKAKFEKTMEGAWKKACQIYLKESGLDEDSQEWKAILATKSLPGSHRHSHRDLGKAQKRLRGRFAVRGVVYAGDEEEGD